MLAVRWRTICFTVAATLVVVAVCVYAGYGRRRGYTRGGVVLLDSEWVDAIPAFGTAMSTDDLTRQIKWLRKHNAGKAASVSPHVAGGSASSLSPPSLSPSLSETPSALLPAASPSSAPSPSQATAAQQDFEEIKKDYDETTTNSGPSWLLKASEIIHEHAKPQELFLTTPEGAALAPANAAAVARMQSLVKDAYSAEANIIAAKTLAARQRMQRRLRSQLAVMAKRIMIKLSQTSDPKITPQMILSLEKALGG
jgi:hypothetical protein